MMNIYEMAMNDDRFTLTTVNKNGREVKGIKLNAFVSAVFYPELFEGTISGLDELYDYLTRQTHKISVDCYWLTDWDNAKDKLILCVQKAGDEDILKMKMLDLEKYVRVVIDENHTTKVTERLAEQWGKTKQDIFKAARANTRKKAVVKSVMQMLAEANGVEFSDAVFDDMLTCVTTEGAMFGAGIIAVKSIREEIAEKIGGDYFVLPSSIHEVLVTPANGMIDVEGLKEMVVNINQSEVDPEDRLSDSVYMYHADTKKLTIAA